MGIARPLKWQQLSHFWDDSTPISCDNHQSLDEKRGGGTRLTTSSRRSSQALSAAASARIRLFFEPSRFHPLSLPTITSFPRKTSKQPLEQNPSVASFLGNVYAVTRAKPKLDSPFLPIEANGYHVRYTTPSRPRLFPRSTDAKKIPSTNNLSTLRSNLLSDLVPFFRTPDSIWGIRTNGSFGRKPPTPLEMASLSPLFPSMCSTFAYLWCRSNHQRHRLKGRGMPTGWMTSRAEDNYYVVSPNLSAPRNPPFMANKHPAPQTPN